MRILVVHDEPIEGGYGAEAYVRRLVQGLREAGDEVDVVAGEVRHEGAGRLRDMWDPKARALVEQRARRLSADVVHFHNVSRELSPAVLAAAADVPAVMTVHDFRMLGAHEHRALSPKGCVERALGRRVRRAARTRLAAAIGVSERVSEALRAHGFRDVTTVGVPAPEPAAVVVPAAQCHDVAIIARLSRDKGVDLAIDAFLAATDAASGRGGIVVAGDGPEGERLRRRYAAYGSRVRFAGHLDEQEVSALLGRSRVVVVASQHRYRPEGSSLALVEAAVHGRPVVASDDPAVREVAEQLAGAVVVPGDAADGLAGALRQLLDDDVLVAELGRRGRANAQRRHSVAAVAAATRAVYDAIAADRP